MMITLKFVMVAMIAGSVMLPMRTENIYVLTTYSKPQIKIVNEVIVPVVPIKKEEEVVNVNTKIVDKVIMPVASIERKEEIIPINMDKTYEQCMREAFERLYEEINRLLDQIPDQWE